MCSLFPHRLVLGVDARNGMVATEGWLEVSKTPAKDLIAEIGSHTNLCAAVVYTDIEKDGMLAGPNFQSLAEIQAASPFPVIASGGITHLDDLEKLAQTNTHGAILGRALYEGRIDLAQALRIS